MPSKKSWQALELAGPRKGKKGKGGAKKHMTAPQRVKGGRKTKITYRRG